MPWDWTTFFFVMIIGLLAIALILTIFWFINLSRKKKKGPSHVELYFDENFRNIMDEWDFSTRDNVKDFRKKINTRLTKVGSEISLLETNRNKLDRRMTTLDKKMNKLEGL